MNYLHNPRPNGANWSVVGNQLKINLYGTISLLQSGVEIPQMTVYIKFSDRVHLFFDRVHFW